MCSKQTLGCVNARYCKGPFTRAPITKVLGKECWLSIILFDCDYLKSFRTSLNTNSAMPLVFRGAGGKSCDYSFTEHFLLLTSNENITIARVLGYGTVTGSHYTYPGDFNMVAIFSEKLWTSVKNNKSPWLLFDNHFSNE